MRIDYTRDLVRSLIENPMDHEWSLQGFGMLRTYLSPEVRLHVWDSNHRVQDVTLMHTHPWHFHSFVVAGVVNNIRYDKGDGSGAKKYMEQEILCGVGGDVTDKEPALVGLVPRAAETYVKGNIYSQLAHEIHTSLPQDGTVTIVEREFLDDADHAYVYYPADKAWVSAEPRPATRDEVADICARSFGTWFQ